MWSEPGLRAIPGAWRWRRNPLRRPSDVVEAWAGLGAVVLAAVAGPAVGVATGRAVDTALRHVAAVQRAERHQVHAVVAQVGRPRPTFLAPDPDDSDAEATSHPATVRWTARDGADHSAVVNVVGRHPVGSTLPMWVDRRGRPVAAPLDRATATGNAVAAGFGAGVMAAALVLAGRHVLGWHLLRRRLADWEREWSRIGQDWGHAGAGG